MSVSLGPSTVNAFRAVNPRYNDYMLHRIRFASYLETLHVSYPYNRCKSDGVQNFVTEMLPVLQANNEHVEFIVQRGMPNHGCHIRATYQYGRLYQRTIDFLTPHQILACCEEFAIGGDFRENRCVQRRLPRRFNQLDNQPGHKGHQPFKVHSRWDQCHEHGVSE